MSAIHRSVQRDVAGSTFVLAGHVDRHVMKRASVAHGRIGQGRSDRQR